MHEWGTKPLKWAKHAAGSPRSVILIVYKQVAEGKLYIFYTGYILMWLDESASESTF